MKPCIEQDSNDGEEINQKDFRNGTNKILELIGHGMGGKEKY